MSISAGSSIRTSYFLPPALTSIFFSTSAASIFWSNATNIGTSRRVGPYIGYIWTAVAGGVSKLNFTAFFNSFPVALLVPAGISTWYVVACGNRTTGSNTSVLVPIQRHLPAGCGDSLTGTLLAASSCDVTATIACENVTVSCGASGTSPSGW